jgi:hypothetical protein
MLARVIVILIYLLKALIIRNGVFKLEVNMCPLNCLKSHSVRFKFQILCVWSTYDLCFGTNQFWHWFYRNVFVWGWNLVLQLNFNCLLWLLWLRSVSARVVPEILNSRFLIAVMRNYNFSILTFDLYSNQIIM